MGASAAMASNQQSIKLYQVTIQNLDGSIKTVIKSVPFGEVDAEGNIVKLFNRVISCVELTEDMLDALWLSALSDAREDIDTLSTSVIRNINLFLSKTNNKPEYTFPAELDLNHAKHIACCLFATKIDFIPPSEYPDINAAVDSPEVIAEKRIQQRQYSLSAPFEVLDAALNSDSAVVEAFLKVNAGYLLHKGSATDFSGRQYKNITPLQAAIIGGDFELAVKMEDYFKKLANGLDIMHQQKIELYKQAIAIYPNTNHAQSIDNLEELIKIHQQAQQENAFNFDEIIQAINKASEQEIEDIHDIYDSPNKTRHLWSFSETKTGKPLIDAFNRFRAQFRGRALMEIIPSPQHLLKAFEINNDRLYRWNSPLDTQWPKSDLLARQVIGFIQRFLNANTAQLVVHGMDNVIEKKANFTGSFKNSHGSSAFYPLRADCWGLGFTTCYWLNGGESGWGGGLCWTGLSKLILHRNKLEEHLYPSATDSRYSNSKSK